MLNISQHPSQENSRNMGVSINGGIPNSSVLRGFSLTHQPFWGTPMLGNLQIIFAAGFKKTPPGGSLCGLQT